MATFHAQATSNLEDGAIESKNIASKRMSRNKRRRYKVSTATKRQDKLDVINASIFEEGNINFKGGNF